MTYWHSPLLNYHSSERFHGLRHNICGVRGSVGKVANGEKEIVLKADLCGTPLAVQWLSFPTPNAGSLGWIPGPGTRSHMPQLRVHVLQLKILHAATKTWHSQINIKTTHTQKKKADLFLVPDCYTNFLLTPDGLAHALLTPWLKCFFSTTMLPDATLDLWRLAVCFKIPCLPPLRNLPLALKSTAIASSSSSTAYWSNLSSNSLILSLEHLDVFHTGLQAPERWPLHKPIFLSYTLAHSGCPLDVDNEQMGLPRDCWRNNPLGGLPALWLWDLCPMLSEKTGGSAEAETGGTEQANMFLNYNSFSKHPFKACPQLRKKRVTSLLKLVFFFLNF